MSDPRSAGSGFGATACAGVMRLTPDRTSADLLVESERRDDAAADSRPPPRRSAPGRFRRPSAKPSRRDVKGEVVELGLDVAREEFPDQSPVVA